MNIVAQITILQITVVALGTAFVVHAWPESEKPTAPVEIVEEKNPPVSSLPEFGGEVKVWVDPEAGCQYLVDRNGRMIPRMGRHFGYAYSIQVCRE